MDAKPRKPYPSDLSDEQWTILEPLLPPPVRAGCHGRPTFARFLTRSSTS